MSNKNKKITNIGIANANLSPLVLVCARVPLVQARCYDLPCNNNKNNNY